MQNLVTQKRQKARQKKDMTAKAVIKWLPLEVGFWQDLDKLFNNLFPFIDNKLVFA